MLIITFGYILLGLFIWRIEKVRIRKYGPDLFTLCIIIIAIQMVFPGIFLTAVIGLMHGDVNAGIPFFTKVLVDVGLYEASMVLFLLFIFLVSLYLTWLFINLEINLHKIHIPKIRIYVSRWRWLIVMALGLLGSWILLKEVGGYNDLALYRMDSAGFGGNFVVGYLFALTMTFLLLAMVGMMLSWRNKVSIVFIFSILLVSIFALMTVSRRPFGIVVLLMLFTFVLEKKKVRITKAQIIAVSIFVPIIIFGERFFVLVAMNSEVTVSAVTEHQTDLYMAIVLFVSNIGISTIESWATFLYLDIPMRFGIDHFLSIIRLIPDGAAGLDLDLPERMVRISTEAFVGPDRHDVPPGFVGQMWLDFRMLGPIFWGISYSFVISFLQIAYNRLGKDPAVISIFVILLYIVCLPINTGTLDFVFSIDVFLLILFIVFIIRIKRYKNSC